MATEYGTRLRQAREYANLTQVELGRRTGIAQTTISTAERLGNGSSDTSVYAKACGVDAHWLATGEGDMVNGPHIYGSREEEIHVILNNDEPQNRSARLADANEHWNRIEGKVVAPGADQLLPGVANKIRPTLTLASHLFELSKLLQKLDEDSKAVATLLLTNWLKNPDSYAQVAAILEMMANTGKSNDQN